MIMLSQTPCMQRAGVQYVLDTVVAALAANPDRKFTFAEMVRPLFTFSSPSTNHNFLWRAENILRARKQASAFCPKWRGPEIVA